MKIILFHLENPNILPVGVKYDEIKNIDKYDDNSIDHVLLQDLCDYYTDNQVETLLDSIKSKISTGGLISIQSIDIRQLAISLVYDDIDTETVKQLLYPLKRSIHTMFDIQTLLINIGYEIISKKYINMFEYHITAKKK